MTTESSEPKAIGANDRDLEEGQPVGEYVIESKIGQGGFGTVFKATHPLIGKVVAIKVLNRQYSAQPEMVSRFVAEARSVNQIRNRFIIDIFGFGQLDDGRHYYVMEYLEGQPLDGYLESNGRLSLADAVPIMRSVARALDAAHSKGIAHRDLKPENIFLATESDGTLYPKLLDFGIAKLLAADDQLKHKTRTGAPIGTPYYMSPEQCRGRDVDHRTDIYAFGCVTYKLLTGRVPFDGDDYMDILMKQMGDPVPSVLAHAPELPPSIDQVIAWMMAKDPAQRPATVIAAVRALEDAAVAAGMALPPITAPLGSMAFSGRTPSGMVALPATPARGMTPRPSDFAGAATLDAGSLQSGAMTPQVAEPVDAPRPRRRVWTFVAAAAVPLIGVFIGVMVMKQGNAADDDGARPAVATQAPPKVERAIETPDPARPGIGAAITTDQEAPATVRVTLTGLPAGTSVLDPDGKVLTTAAGGDTVITLTTGTSEVTIGLHHPTLGDNYVMLTPSENLLKPAPALIPQTTTPPDVGGKKSNRPRKDPDKDRPTKGGDGKSGDGKPDGGGKAPGGDNSNATERPVFKQ